MSAIYRIFIFLTLIRHSVVLANLGGGYDSGGSAMYSSRAQFQRPGVVHPSTIQRRRGELYPVNAQSIAPELEMDEELGPATPKAQIQVPRDYDDLLDGSRDGEELDIDYNDEEDIKCVVDAKRPYGTSPNITLTGINQRFNSLLVGYDVHNEGKRANKASLYGWSSPKSPSEAGVSNFNFDLDYVSILPQAGTPLSYCALVFVPPLVPKFDMRSVFGKPSMSMERYFGSEEHLLKAVKKKSRKVTSCCFIAYPMVSRR